jgi:hypothetical protein
MEYSASLILTAIAAKTIKYGKSTVATTQKKAESLPATKFFFNDQ